MNFKKLDNTGKVEGFCLIKSIDKKVSVKGDTYLDITVGDQTGEMNAKLWGYKPEEHGEFASGDIVKIRGSINLYNGAEQLRLERIRPVMESDDVKVEELVQSAAYGSEDMYDTLVSLADKFSDAELKKLVLTIYADRKEKLLYWPAAYKLHHAMRGGLLMHTLSIVRLCESVCNVYPFIDREILIAGAMLHDIAKIDEYEVNNAGTADKYSVKGNLLGHITMGAELVGRYGEKLGINEELITLLKHMILSHHGVPEFGAAVRPMFIEAEILSELDLMDARIYEMKEAVTATEKGGFSNKVWALENIKLYNHGRKKLDKAPDLL